MVEEERRSLVDSDDGESPYDGLEALKKELAEQRAKAEANLAGWQRAQADLVNYKRRTDQEKEEGIKFANANLVLKVLPVLDDFERAVASLPKKLAENPWVEGVRHIERKLRTTLEAAGLSPIESVGLPFDPRVHEAVRQDNGEEGVILQEAEKGYKFLDRVIRASKVVVGNGEGTAPQEEETETTGTTD